MYAVAIAGLVVAVMAGIAAGLSWWSSVKSNRLAQEANQHARTANKHAEEANAIAEEAQREAGTVAQIEQDRRRSELTPKFGFSFTADSDQTATLTAEFTGPAELDRLDEVVITILDEPVDRWGHGYPQGVSEDEARLFVWGPWHFNTGASVQIADRRTTQRLALDRTNGKNIVPLPLERTRPGRWMTGTSQEKWLQDRGGTLRLHIACRRGDLTWDDLTEDLQAAGPAQHVW
jgi:hypothetical protein